MSQNLMNLKQYSSPIQAAGRREQAIPPSAIYIAKGITAFRQLCRLAGLY
jgi:hypothetical protein